MNRFSTILKTFTRIGLIGFLGVSYAQQVKNPIIFADVPDMSMIRVGDTYYMSSTTMHLNRRLALIKSKDLVKWVLSGYGHTSLQAMDDLNLSNGNGICGRGT